jgi:hypothetical protein
MSVAGAFHVPDRAPTTFAITEPHHSSPAQHISQKRPS